MRPLNDTIAAIATPPGEGAISVIRVSGPAAIGIADGLFRGRVRISEAPSHTMHHGVIVDRTAHPVDDVVVAVFRAPASYTGEDAVEISCHGGVFVTREILASVVSAGARVALPGEFTRRAYLNGKMDLAQAEAVAEIIRSRSARSLRLSLEHLRGDLSDRVNALRDELLAIAAGFELELDFSEEGLEIVDRTAFKTKLLKISDAIASLLSTFRSGRLTAEGVKVGIIGKPNVGKSSLMNKLLQSDRAIVTDIPGTTRDTITESIEVAGLLFQLTDTAGLREGADAVEREGIKRSNDVITTSDVLLVLHDAREFSAEDLHAEISMQSDQKRIDVINKIDLVEGVHKKSLQESEASAISAKTGEGLDEFKARLARTVLGSSAGGTGEHITVTKLRHAKALEEAQVYIINSEELIQKNAGNELIAVSLRKASQVLSEITGNISSDDVLNAIFSSFCIGK
jgi:tRNA modification GTPase